jgi:anti-sigma B factor antagonist
MHLEVDVLRIGPVAVVSVVGDLDAYTSPQLRRTLMGIGSDGAYRVEMRLQAVEHIDSFGMGALLAGIRAVEAGGGSVSTFVNPRVARYLKLAGLGFSLHFTVDTIVLGATG